MELSGLVLPWDAHNKASSNPKEKSLNVYRNGKPESITNLIIREKWDLSDITKEIKEKFRFKDKDRLRLFTVEGVEVSLEDLKYMKENTSIFVSKGESFSKSSLLCEYTIIKKLGEGGFGEVSLAVHKVTKRLVAIKFLKKPTEVDCFGLDRFFAEAETLKHLKHRNIVEIINCFTLKDMQIAIVMEYLEGGPLFDYIREQKRIPESEAREFFNQIIDAVSHCHANKVIHCDLKLENVLLQSRDSKLIKVIDFGISGLKTHFKSKVGGGTLHHMAPELFSKKHTLHSGIDVWAIGCMLYEMVCGRWAFDGETKNHVIERIRKGKFSFYEYKKQLSPEIRDLITRMLEVDQTKRITMYGILSHPWVTGKTLSKGKSKENNASLDQISSGAENKTNYMNIKDEREDGIKVEQIESAKQEKAV